MLLIALLNVVFFKLVDTEENKIFKRWRLGRNIYLADKTGIWNKRRPYVRSHKALPTQGAIAANYSARSERCNSLQ
jgi:hypothetical protein